MARPQLPPLPGGPRPCECGTGCGLTIERTRANRCRRYAVDCPGIAERRRQQAADEQREYYRRRHGDPLRPRECKCGCGRVFTRASAQQRVLYAPDCPNAEWRARAPHAFATRNEPRKATGDCELCAGLEHRRARPHCPRCKGPFRELPPLDPRDPRFQRQPWDGAA